MKLVKATEEHLLSVMEWVKDPDVFSIWAGPNFRYPFDQQSFIEDIKLYNDKLVNRVLVKDNTPLAFGQIYDRVGRTQLSRLIVNPDYQGQGIGTELISRLLELGHECLDTADYSLFVMKDNPRAKKLYESLGFVETEYPEAMPMENCDYMVKKQDTNDA
ncbi:GNAT family N-acetyltransferase [Kangiella shandongensis]|uniref:GNAT family N-acetyltransferase n=1 Tax=Kangiella shandongensis TaxID=2763258 RepID=UPI001CBE1B70|nr:GNAT family N-acetyltransferase [Kangiella shandongensis]